MDIKYYLHSEIDKIKWDNVIDNALNSNIYAYSWCLDSLTNNQWDALIAGNYKVIMPLPRKTKWGFNYIYQPYFNQQLGIFSINEINAELVALFLKELQLKYKLIHLHLNEQNPVTAISKNCTIIKRTNFQLKLNCSYISIYDNYNSDCKKNLSKSQIAGYQVRKNVAIEMVSQSFFHQYGVHYPNNQELEKKIIDCAKKAISLNRGFTRALYGTDGKLWCCGFFMIDNSKIYYTMASSTAEGRKVSAIHTLIDEIIKEYATQNYIFDFEGSDIPNVAFLYAKFGSYKTFYHEIHCENLSFISKKLKSTYQKLRQFVK